MSNVLEIYWQFINPIVNKFIYFLSMIFFNVLRIYFHEISFVYIRSIYDT